MLVVIKKDCPYCEQFRNSYEKGIKAKYGQVRIAYIPLKSTSVTKAKLPMIIIGKSPTDSVAIEGLPSLDLLLRIIGARLGTLE